MKNQLKTWFMKVSLVLSFSVATISTFAQNPEHSTPGETKTIVLITGSFVHNSVWENWKAYFENKGYTVIVPVLPQKTGTAAQLRKMPNAALAALSLNDITAYYADTIGKLKEKPILIGHSQGGLIVQLLLQRDLAVSGIAIHPVPPKGVLSFKFSFIKSVRKPLGYFTSTKKNYMMSLSDWQYTFTNGMTLEEQKETYEKYTIPESKKATRGGLTNAAKIDFKKPHAPLLIISGSNDHIIPASLNYSNYKKYRDTASVTAYKEFEGRNHFVLGQPTWIEEADYIAKWIAKT